MSSSSILTVVGILVILHSALSCLHYRSLVADLVVVSEDDEHSIPPLDVKVEVIAGFLLTLIGQLLSVGALRDIKSAGISTPQYITRDFDIYYHRGLALANKNK
jgi:hypothetical protein